MNYLLISILIGAFFIASTILGLILGLHYGQKFSRGETIEKPKLNPVKAIKENIKEIKLTKDEEKKQQEIQNFIDAMESYDGSVIN